MKNKEIRKTLHLKVYLKDPIYTQSVSLRPYLHSYIHAD